MEEDSVSSSERIELVLRVCFELCSVVLVDIDSGYPLVQNDIVCSRIVSDEPVDESEGNAISFCSIAATVDQ